MYSTMAGNLPSASGRMSVAASLTPSRTGTCTNLSMRTLYFGGRTTGLPADSSSPTARVTPSQHATMSTSRRQGDMADTSQRIIGNLQGAIDGAKASHESHG